MQGTEGLIPEPWGSHLLWSNKAHATLLSLCSGAHMPKLTSLTSPASAGRFFTTSIAWEAMLAYFAKTFKKEHRWTWVWILTLLGNSCVLLGKLLRLLYMWKRSGCFAIQTKQTKKKTHWNLGNITNIYFLFLVFIWHVMLVGGGSEGLCSKHPADAESTAPSGHWPFGHYIRGEESWRTMHGL